MILQSQGVRVLLMGVQLCNITITGCEGVVNGSVIM